MGTTILYSGPFNDGTEIQDDSDYDPVDKPGHYANPAFHGGEMECIDWIKEELGKDEFEGYLKGCALKYIWRYKEKANPTQDLAKAQWYLHKLETLWEEKCS